MKRQLIVAVREPEYIRRLSDYLRDSPFGRQWQLTAFTGDDTLRTFCREATRSICLSCSRPFCGRRSRLRIFRPPCS
ncbi:hypothetical protein PACILC2_29110 [Paenibacillus cisolokensis]|uniref:Uncharacterized protein n=1 Tax=Paenibacillus cisolokensis TaxID=1658519 RepID=A0ABQ4N7W1_9BACL|nr:hypothetical protein [Paenibacillus cisolokensis]GIQ64343.1 hypothetical protein PACILC2_29110 [Paenibacillus cisolokensis]